MTHGPPILSVCRGTLARLRAGRLVSVLLLLQTRERMTAQELARCS